MKKKRNTKDDNEEHVVMVFNQEYYTINTSLAVCFLKPNESNNRENPPITPLHRLIANPKIVDIFELLKLIYGADFKKDEGFQFYTNLPSLDVVENMMPGDQCEFPDI